jgi:hypothetical protein
MNDKIDVLLNRINDCCKKIAERDGFELDPIGGYIIDNNNKWEGEGKYVEKNGEMQWELKNNIL